jgi:TolB-like protein/DNA-binding winged helix-turn-helix (wHTH) protein
VVNFATHPGVSAGVNDLPLSHAPIRFGVFELDTESRELRKQGVKIRLQDQPFQILQLLLEHPGRVVTREELQRRIWPADTFVDFDRGLYNAIKKLREALGDSADTPRYIETLSRRGYRFMAGLHGNGHAGAEVSTFPAARSRANWKPGIGIASVAAVLLAVGLGATRLWPRFSGRSTPQIRSIAVLPLQNLSADPAQEYFSDGMTDALITDLAQFGGVRVISRTSSMQYKQTRKSLPEIARELNVDAIVEGTVQRSGDRVRITAQLVQGPSDKHLWANSYERDIRDVFALERDVASEISRQVETNLEPGKQTVPSIQRAVDPQVLEAYLQGNYHLQRHGNGFGDEEKREAAQYFQQATNADPTFTQAYVGLVNAHNGLLWPTSDDVAAYKMATAKVTEIDPDSAQSHIYLGDAKRALWDWSAAEEEYRKAIARNPSSVDAHISLYLLFSGLGRLDEGMKEAEIAQALDSVDDNLSDALYAHREYDRAIEVAKLFLLKDPGNGGLHEGLRQYYQAKGLHKETVEEMGKVAIAFGQPEWDQRIRQTFARSGFQAALREVAKGLEDEATHKQIFSPVHVAAYYAALNDKDRAFYWLEQAYLHHDLQWLAVDYDLPWINVDPSFDPLRSDPRFRDLLRRMKLLSQ